MNETRFVFNASTLVDGFIPMPPGLSAGASDLLTRLLTHAVGESPRLRVLNHNLAIATTQELEDASQEILRTKFPMPCEGWDEPIPTIDSIALQPAAMHFTVNAIFAAYLSTMAHSSDALRRLSVDANEQATSDVSFSGVGHE